MLISWRDSAVRLFIYALVAMSAGMLAAHTLTGGSSQTPLAGPMAVALVFFLIFGAIGLVMVCDLVEKLPAVPSAKELKDIWMILPGVGCVALASLLVFLVAVFCQNPAPRLPIPFRLWNELALAILLGIVCFILLILSAMMLLSAQTYGDGALVVSAHMTRVLLVSAPSVVLLLLNHDLVLSALGVLAFQAIVATIASLKFQWITPKEPSTQPGKTA